MTSSSICACFCWCIYLQYAMRFIGIIMSKPVTILPGQLSLVLWYVECTTKSSDARIFNYGIASTKYVFCRLYVRTRFPITWCIISMILFACGFNWESGLVLIRYALFYQASFKLVNKKLSYLRGVLLRKKIAKLIAKMAEETPWNKVCVGLIHP